MRKELFKVKLDNQSIHYVFATSFSDVEEIIRDNSRGQSIIESIELLCDELFILKRMSVEIGNYVLPSTKEERENNSKILKGEMK